jgi:tetratricopeptide (TPR) repeat protein
MSEIEAMTFQSNDESMVRGPIAAWLSVTKTLEPDSGLDPADARRRAGELLKLILGGKIRPADVELTEDFKDVLSSLVGSLRDFELIDQRRTTADAVYQFISRSPWPDKHADEKRDLLFECAERGLGLKEIEAVYVRRNAGVERFEPAAGDGATATGLVRTITDKALEALKKGGDRGTLDLILAATNKLGRFANVCPTDVQAAARSLIEGLERSRRLETLFDGRDYVCGELMLLAAATTRQMGNWGEAKHLAETASRYFRKTLQPRNGLLRVDCEYLALQYESKHYEHALILAQRLAIECRAADLVRARLKCELIVGSSLKELNRVIEAVEHLSRLRGDPAISDHPSIRSAVLIRLANALSLNGRYSEAEAIEAEALSLLSSLSAPMMLADLKVVIAERLRDQGRLTEAVRVYRLGIADFAGLGMTAFVANFRILLAETLIALNRSNEAIEEIKAALPVVDRGAMVPEGLAAVALLKESVRRRKTDPNALRELREHLQKQR